MSNQLFPPFHLAVISLVHPITVRTFEVICPALFPSRLSVSTHTRRPKTIEQTDGHRQSIFTGTLRKSVLSFNLHRRRDLSYRRGSVIQQNTTKLALIASISTVTQTTQGKYWLELQRLQHRIQQIIVQTRDPRRKLPARTPIAVLEQLRDRIKCISFNMNALDTSCSVEAATGFALPSPD